MKRSPRRPAGQVIITLLGAYIFFLVLAAIVLNSALLTQEKIKLQNTADIGAFAAAEVQRLKLNRIRQANRVIEALWRQTQMKLLLPGPCYMPWANCLTTVDCHICPMLDALQNGLIMQDYLGQWLQYRDLLLGPRDQRQGNGSRELQGDILNANLQAGIAALENSLLEKNLPPQLAEQLRKTFGGHYPPLETLLRLYTDPQEQGPDLGLGDLNGDRRSDTLKEVYQPIEAFSHLPFSKWQVEIRPTQGWLYYYQPTWAACGAAAPNAKPVIQCSRATIPIPVWALARIIPNWPLGGIPTRFYTDPEFKPLYVHGLLYHPLLSFDLFIPKGEVASRAGSWLPPRNPFAVWVSPSERQSIPRRSMVAIAAAMPTGGRPPGPKTGDVGEEYTGSRLVGLNDQGIAAQQLQLISKFTDGQITVDQLKEALFLKNPPGTDAAYGAFDLQDFLH